MTHKVFDLVVKTGSYNDAQGQEKGRYENVGSMMEGDNGPFLILKRTFNPAGVPNPDCKDSVIVSCFSDQPTQQGGQAPQQNAPQQQGGYSQQPQQQGGYSQSAPQQPQQNGYGNHKG